VDYVILMQADAPVVPADHGRPKSGKLQGHAVTKRPLCGVAASCLPSERGMPQGEEVWLEKETRVEWLSTDFQK
jgi:hypothetical protein